MLKVRVQGTPNEIKWFKKFLERSKTVRVLQFSEAFANVGTKKYFRVYAEVEKESK